MKLSNSLLQYKNVGYILMIIGPMFAEKTTEAIRLGNLLQLAELRCLMVRYSKDNRYNSEHLSTHDGMMVNAFHADDLQQIQTHFAVDGVIPFDVVIVDELQFYNSKTFVETCVFWRSQGIIVICDGLDLKSDKSWWENTLELMREKDYVIFLEAVCLNCKARSASFTWSPTNKNGEISIGGAEKYMAVCSHCYTALSLKGSE